MKKLLLFIVILSQGSLLCGMGPGVPVNLKSEHLENPLGIDCATPRLSWQLGDSAPGARQKAYRIIVGTDSLRVQQDQGNMWDTRKTDSEKMLVSYGGKALGPFTKYYWKVITWDHQNKQASAAIRTFETGMMSMDNWQGSWIKDNEDAGHKPAPYFRKELALDKKVKSARAYIAAAGLYELYLNGEKVGNHRLDPL
ncbi:MAG: alpha-L-rhamnosidase N-terminal domain-containing protein, partial [Bacteroidales bacterium]